MKNWRTLHIDALRLRNDITSLAEVGRDAQGRLARIAFSAEYESARRWLKQRFDSSGIEYRDDGVGNCIGRVGPAGTECILSGSHIDTVLDGGPLDGAYGVIAAMEVARVLKETELQLPRAYECIAFIDEEGAYFDCLGSKAMCGLIKQTADLKSATNVEGKPLIDAMREVGLDPSGVPGAARSNRDIAAYVELHIEQGPVLETEGMAIGNVEAIVGTSNQWITFFGEPNHSGTTPMTLRRDAFTGAAEFAYRARELALADGTPNRVRLTYGIVQSEPQGHTVIPSTVRLFQEIREVSEERKAFLIDAIQVLATEVAARHRLEVAIDTLPACSAMTMSDRVRSAIADACAADSIEAYDMPSGAVHDAQNLARLTDAGMIFVPSQGGRSHRSDEWTDWPFLEKGANVLLQTVLRLIYQ